MFASHKTGYLLEHRLSDNVENQIGLRRLRLRRLKFVREHSSWQRQRKTSSDWSASSARGRSHRCLQQLSRRPTGNLPSLQTTYTAPIALRADHFQHL